MFPVKVGEAFGARLEMSMLASAPVSPLGIVKLKVVVVPAVEAETDAFVPAFPVVVDPAAMVGVTPAAPAGIVKLKSTPVAGWTCLIRNSHTSIRTTRSSCPDICAIQYGRSGWNDLLLECQYSR